MKAPNEPTIDHSSAALPRWITVPGWVVAVGSVLFSLLLVAHLSTVPPDLKAGIVDLFFPGPSSLSMLAWAGAHVWAIVSFLALLRLLLRGQRVAWWDVGLVVALWGGVVSGRLLLSRLAAHGVTVVVPGIIS